MSTTAQEFRPWAVHLRQKVKSSDGRLHNAQQFLAVFNCMRYINYLQILLDKTKVCQVSQLRKDLQMNCSSRKVPEEVTISDMKQSQFDLVVIPAPMRNSILIMFLSIHLSRPDPFKFIARTTCNKKVYTRKSCEMKVHAKCRDGFFLWPSRS